MLWASSHAQEEFDYLLRHQVPTDVLVRYADDVSGKKHPVFPRSLQTSAGQKLGLVEAKRVAVWKTDMPWMAFTLRNQARDAAQLERQARSRDWALAIVETVLVRCAEEKTPKVILGYASIQAACKAATGWVPENYLRIHQLLDRLVDRGAPFKIEHGKRGRFGKATKFMVQLPSHTNATSKAAQEGEAQVKDWIVDHVYALMAAMESEQVARETLLSRKEEYAATAGGVIPWVDEWIRQNSVRVGRSWQVSFPGDAGSSFLSREGGAQEPGVPLVMEHSTPSDQQCKKFDVPKSPAPAPAQRTLERPKQVPWWQRKLELQAAGATEKEILLDGLDFSIPEEQKRKKPTWAEARKQMQDDSLARLRQRLAEKGIPW